MRVRAAEGEYRKSEIRVCFTPAMISMNESVLLVQICLHVVRFGRRRVDRGDELATPKIDKTYIHLSRYQQTKKQKVQCLGGSVKMTG